MTFRGSAHYEHIEKIMGREIKERFAGDIVAYARATFDYDGSLSGREGLGRVVIERLCDEISKRNA